MKDPAMLKPLNRILKAIEQHEGIEAATPERAEDILNMLLKKQKEDQYQEQMKTVPMVDKIDVSALKDAPLTHGTYME